MEKIVRSIIGLLLFALGIGFLVTIVPRMQGTDLRLGDYVWAFVIIFACSVGFGLIAAGVFWEDDHSQVTDGDTTHGNGGFPR